MSNKLRVTVLLAAVLMFALMAGTAYGYTGYWTPCSGCHNGGGLTIAVTPGAVTGDNQVFTFTATGAQEWAVFAGYTKLASGAGASGGFSVPVGTYYQIYAVAGSIALGQDGFANFSSDYAWVEDWTDETAPVSTSDAVASYSDKAVIRIDAADAGVGVEYIYYTVNGGSIRATNVGVGGYALAVVKPTSAGTFNYTLEFWAQDRNGNLEAENVATFVVDASGYTSPAGLEPSTVSGPNGASPWSYQDAYDATAKREGGYLAYGGTSGFYPSSGVSYDTAGGWVDQTLYGSKGPHGGYDTTTNKCKTCHAVHRAEGTYYLLRATSSDDACDYCHIGGGAHSAKVVYINDGDKYTNNGHTMGSGPTIPDSSVEMAIEHVTIDRVGDADIEVPVRVYEADKKELFRVVGFGRHPAGHPSFGYGETATQQANGPVFAAVGPTSLSCSNCHQTHNATSLIWQPLDRAATPTGYNDSGTTRLTGGYKLLRAFPGASVPASSQHDKEMGEMLGSSVLAKVPESTLLPYAYKGLVAADKATNPAYAASYPGANSYGIALFKDEVAHESGATAADTQYLDWDGYTWQSPDWAVNSHGWHDYDFDVQRYALAVWCADCHNLNIGGRGVEEGEAELGFFKAHAERTHPVPASRGFQCYSCHRGSLDYNLAFGESSDMTGTSCTNCHFASSEYKVAQAVAGTDWPHSSGADDYKLLGNFSLSAAPSAVGFDYASTTENEAAGTFGYDKTTITKDNLDAVCLRCHTDIGVMN